MPDVDDPATGRSGTFVVDSADETAVVLQDVATTQVHTVATEDLEAALEDVPMDPDGQGEEIAAGTVLEGTTITPAADGVRWTVDAVGESRWIPVERVDLEPTKRSRDTARETEIGELSTHERAGSGSVHVLAVPPDRLDAAAVDVLEDPATRRRGARLGVDRIEIRTGTTGNRSADGESDGSESADGEFDSDASDGGGEPTGVLSVRYLPN